MTSSRSLFTEAIEDHLALKKLNTALEVNMPLARFDVGDPLDRYPGGPVRPATGEATQEEVFVDVTSPATTATAATPALGGTVGEHTEAFTMPLDASDVALGRPVEPLSGLTPMLSLVEDLDDEDDLIAPSSMLSPVADFGADDAAAVLRFPGGAGPRETEVVPAEALPYTQVTPAVTETFATTGGDDAQLTGEQPVIVIDADEPLASIDTSEPRRTPSPRRKKGGSFFGLRKKKNEDPDGEGWFAGQPRDFTWND